MGRTSSSHVVPGAVPDDVLGPVPGAVPGPEAAPGPEEEPGAATLGATPGLDPVIKEVDTIPDVMVSSCVAFGCTNRAKQKPGITFHVFPKDKTLRDAWQRAVRRDGWEPKNADVLCSEHFEANCFDRTGQTTRLRPGSIPTIFPAFPAHLQKPAKRKREAPKCQTALSPVVSAEAAVEMPSEPSSPAKDWYRSKAEESAQEVLQLKKKVKTLQQSKRRLSKRCDASENLIKELKERKLLSEKGLEVFEATFSPEIQRLLVRAHEKTNKMYPPELRAFALTLHYYSAAAYEYVRSKFNNALS
nr:THAP domain-containing protein 2-like [Rhipicephalus microplus]